MHSGNKHLALPSSSRISHTFFPPFVYCHKQQWRPHSSSSSWLTPHSNGQDEYRWQGTRLNGALVRRQFSVQGRASCLWKSLQKESLTSSPRALFLSSSVILSVGCAQAFNNWWHGYRTCLVTRWVPLFLGLVNSKTFLMNLNWALH